MRRRASAPPGAPKSAKQDLLGVPAPRKLAAYPKLAASMCLTPLLTRPLLAPNFPSFQIPQAPSGPVREPRILGNAEVWGVISSV